MKEWFFNNLWELIGTISGLIYLYLSVKQNIWLWVVGFFSSTCYIFVFWDSQLYGDMVLQFYYLLVSIYGLWHWKHQSATQKTTLKISNLTIKEWILIVSIWIIGFALTGYILKKFTGASLPFIDMFVTVGSFIATWLLARKVIENWLLWVMIDAISVFMFLFKELYLTAFLFLIYTCIAWWGYLKWKKSIEKISVSL